MDDVTAVPNHTTTIPLILDLFNGNSSTTNSSTSTPHETVMKNPNKTLPLIFICGIAFVILICCIVAKIKKSKNDDNRNDLDDSYNWDSTDDCGRVSRIRDEKMYDHKFTCHDHKSHYQYEPQLHGGHYDLNRKNTNQRSNHEYEKVNSGGGTV